MKKLNNSWSCYKVLIIKVPKTQACHQPHADSPKIYVENTKAHANYNFQSQSSIKIMWTQYECLVLKPLNPKEA